MADWFSTLKNYLIQQSEAKAREGLKNIDDVTTQTMDRIKNPTGKYGPPLPNEATPQELALSNTLGQGVIGSVTPGGSNLTFAEKKFWDKIFENGANKAELLESVPSAKYENGKFTVSKDDLSKLADFISDTKGMAKGQGEGVLPPSFYNNQFPLKSNILEKSVESPSSLPMDEASRMARAKEMGFNTEQPLYHGTKYNFNKFTPSDQGSLGKGVYTTPDSKYASSYALDNRFDDKTGQNVIPLYTKAKIFDLNNPEHINLLPENLKKGYGDVYGEAVSDEAKKLGFGGLSQKGNGTVIFDPKDVRSKFAEFNPSKINSSDISAGIAALTGVGGAAASSMDDNTPEEEKFSSLKSKLGKY